MGWLILLAVIVLLAILPLGVSVIYEESGADVWILAGPLRIRVYPRKKKPEEKPEKPEWESAEKTKKQAPSEVPRKRGSWKDFLPLVRLGMEFLGDLRKKVRVKRLELDLCMAGDDPCDLAISYGRANAAMGTLLAALNQIFVIRKQRIKINCDFEAEEMTIYARLDAVITIGRLLLLFGKYGVRGLKTYLNLSKIRKGGASL